MGGLRRLSDYREIVADRGGRQENTHEVWMVRWMMAEVSHEKQNPASPKRELPVAARRLA